MVQFVPTPVKVLELNKYCIWKHKQQPLWSAGEKCAFALVYLERIKDTFDKLVESILVSEFLYILGLSNNS